MVARSNNGGIAGNGDGRAADFSTTAVLVRVVWEDPRDNAGRDLVRAPIESIEVVALESFPVQYRAKVVSGLPNGCARFDHYTVGLDSDARLFTIEIINAVPEQGADVVCTLQYGMVSHSIPLDGVVSGITYKVVANDAATTFRAQ